MRHLHVTVSAAALSLAALAAPALAQSGPELIVGWAEPSDTLNPVTTSKRNTGPLMVNIFDTLVWLTPEFEVEPLLATEWSVSEDGLTYTFKLREDVKFHDGTPFNAEAVVANIKYITDPDTKAKISIGLLGPCKEAEATGEFELALSCSKPFAPLLPQLGEPYMGIQSPAAIEKWGADVGQHPTGTGPFKFVSWTPSQSIVLERNDDYNWMAPSLGHEGAPMVSKITFQVVTNPQSRVSQFQSGQSHVMQQTPGLYWKTLSAGGQYNGYEVPISGLGIFAPINAGAFPTDDVNVRKAIMHAVDITGVVQLAEAGVYPINRTPLSAGMLGVTDELAEMYPFSPEKADALLTEAGWSKNGDGIYEKDGKTLSVKVTAIADKAHYKALGQAIQGYLTKAGFDAKLELLTAPAWSAANIAGEMTLTPLQYIGVDPDALYAWFTPEQYFNWSHWSDPELTALLEKGRVEQDTGKRAEIYEEVQRVLLDNAVILPVRQNLDLTMSAKNVKGLTWAGGGFQYFGAVTVD